jgi:type VI secretion system protein ImpA
MPPITRRDQRSTGSGAPSSHSGEAVRCGQNPGSSGPIRTRSNALDLLETVAKWFETHEPQSILPSEIRKAIRRGKMSPQELYLDLISDTEVRRQLYKDVGMTLPEGE